MIVVLTHKLAESIFGKNLKKVKTKKKRKKSFLIKSMKLKILTKHLLPEPHSIRAPSMLHNKQIMVNKNKFKLLE